MTLGTRMRLLVLTALFAGLTFACAGAPSPVMRQIDQAERKWKSLGITSYRISVRQINSIWHAQTVTLTVENGQVKDQSAYCDRAPAETKCTVQDYDPNAYTVPGLFATARAQATPPNGRYLTVKFDDARGFPNTIAIDNPQAVDDDRTWRVISFEVR